MEYFLESIAKSLHSEYGNALNRHCLVFPNRRAGLYFLKYLAARIDKPVWAPSILTINELFRSFSSLQVAGNETLLFELYKIYRRISKTPESFDEFYFWGDMLLSDFDDVDKYLTDASALFSNVQDIRNIDQQFGGLTGAQVEILRRFWVNFDPEKPTNEKTGFISLWSILLTLYTDFRDVLRSQNLAYEGMVFREVAEKSGAILKDVTTWDLVHFIGFNALNECEKTIMLSLKRAGKARFYWDYDNSFIKEGNHNSAGFFLQENLKLFGNDMPSDWSYDTMLSVSSIKVKRRVIEASSDVAQVKLISQLLAELPDLTSGNAHHTAVVLADENLLMPVLTSLPEDTGDINITMGYPLKQTLVYTLVRHLMELQRTSRVTDGVIRFSYKEVINVLRHSLMKGFLDESDEIIAEEIIKNNLVWIPASRFSGSVNLSGIFIKPSTPSSLAEYFRNILSLIALDETYLKDQSADNAVQRSIRNEFIYRIVISINRLDPIVNSGDVTFTSETYIRILDRMLRMQSVPFSGEPLSGVQIMGILETRALDFRNLIMLSVNDGVMPALSSASSFIPFTLREAFGLPSVNHQESVYAYHFYRLLQRAENVTFTYNSNSEGLRSGEMSRFILQMKYDDLLKPDFSDLSFEIKTQSPVSEVLNKSEEHNNILRSRYLAENNGRVLSPSAINTWLYCRMKFYYQYVNLLKEPDTVVADIDPAMLGNILHDLMRRLYTEYKGRVLSKETVHTILSNEVLLQNTINESISAEFNKSSEGFINGNELIVRDVLLVYLKKILNTDEKLAPITLMNLEDSFSVKIDTISDGKDIGIRTGGKVDRIDMVSGVTRIVDYKTGTVAETVNSIADLFANDRKKDYDGWLQTLLYCEAWFSSNNSKTLYPSIYKIKKLSGGVFSDKLKLRTESKSELIVDDYSLVREEFLSELKRIISEIFSMDEPFIMTTEIRAKCSYCPYQKLCMR
ncbi:MAG: PD-(D/E)XK nuclease family protein [Bacteroidales bacterium]|nr:PD-(D/E)XK nuclease family protein [Bacteroidales bacterium]